MPKFAVSLPEFHGIGEPQACLDWLHTCEKIMEFRGIPIDRRVALAAKYLCGRASNWWRRLKASRSCHGKPKIIAWKKFSKHITQKFTPTNYTHHRKLNFGAAKPQFSFSKQQHPIRNPIAPKSPSEVRSVSYPVQRHAPCHRPQILLAPQLRRRQHGHGAHGMTTSRPCRISPSVDFTVPHHEQYHLAQCRYGLWSSW